MIGLLILAGAVGLVAATAALWAQGRAMIHQRVFAGLISLAVSVILFSLIAWAAAMLPAQAPAKPRAANSIHSAVAPLSQR